MFYTCCYVALKAMEYQVIYTGQGAGYNMHDKIKIESKNVNDIAWEINRKAKLQWMDLGLIEGNLDEMTFGTRIDGITFDTPVLKVRRVNAT